MRHLSFFIPFLLLASTLFAQNKSADYVKGQPNVAVAKARSSECFVRKFDAGTSALRRGDYPAALRLFEEAKKCPDAINSSRRLRELEARIEYCNTQLGRRTASSAADVSGNNPRRVETVETTARKFYISKALANNRDANCYQLTVREADRAFRDSCWDDAAKLYRAAKNCADANQLHREQMSNKIDLCKAAAEDELLQKEQKAIRTARHAIAANLANEAMDILRQGNRSLAWRLADFANFYVAPDDNPDCLEAMYGAYHYQAHSSDKISARPPFCYQLAEDLNSTVQFKFKRNKFGDHLLAFFPTENTVVTYALPSMKIMESYSTDVLQDPIGFDVAPDGTLLFFGSNYFYLPNGQKKDVAQVREYCFSEDGGKFFYEDSESQSIIVVNLDESARYQQQQKKGNNTNFGWVFQSPSICPITPGLRTMKAYKNELWLGYNDRVEVLMQDRISGNMVPRMTWRFTDTLETDQDILSMYLYPGTREAVVGTSQHTFYYFLHQPQVDTSEVYLPFTKKVPGRTLGCTVENKALTMIGLEQSLYSTQSTVGMYTPESEYPTHKFDTQGAFSGTIITNVSDDGHWLVCQDANNVARLWSMRDTCVSAPIALDQNGKLYRLSADGNRLFELTETSIKVFDADDVAGGALLEANKLPLRPELVTGISSNWMPYLSGEAELSLQQLDTRQIRRFPLENTPGGFEVVPFALDPTEAAYVAYSPGNGQVVVTSLDGNGPQYRRDFGGRVTVIRWVPGTDKLVVVSRTDDRFTVRLWAFNTAEPPQVVRLQNYRVMIAQVSAAGDRLALSDGVDIRIFLIDNLKDEVTAIKAHAGNFLNDVAFRSDGLALVSGDTYGNVGIWDVNTGQPMMRFLNTWEGQLGPVLGLAFAYEGTRLRLLSYERLMTANLDAYSLREVVQSENRWLMPFTPDQIRDYNLEIAFKYPGNFDRLAASGDFPLIGSFFKYFSDQAKSSNNIEQVRTYCERAQKLYELLDGNGQKNLEYTMFEMYENYVLKLLLRGQTEEASRIVMQLEKRYNRPNVSIMAAAHSSLLRHDLQAAARLYTDFLLRLPFDDTFNYALEDINSNLLQFQEYDLLDSTQIDCLCSVFQQFTQFKDLCPLDKNYQTLPMSAQVAAYKRIFYTLDSLDYVYDMGTKTRREILEKLLAEAQTLDYPNPGVEKHPFEVVAIALAKARISEAAFEQNAPVVSSIYTNTIDFLNKLQPFRQPLDTARLSLLTQAHWLLGNYLLQNDKPADAAQHYTSALSTAQKMSPMVSATGINRQHFDIHVLGALHLMLGEARLLQGRTEEARAALNTAADIASTPRHALLAGNIALMQGDETEAFLEYGGLKTAASVGEALFQIHRLAETQPANKDRLLSLSSRLHDGYLRNHPEVHASELGYWFAVMEKNRFAAQNRNDSAFYWSSAALRHLTVLLDQPTILMRWQDLWLDESLSNAYFLLLGYHNDAKAISEVIRYSREVLDYAKSGNLYYAYMNYYYSNLGHALWLRNEGNDREVAIAVYKEFINDGGLYTNWELLEKDFRDLHRAGVRWPELRKLVQAIVPEGVQISAESWREMGE